MSAARRSVAPVARPRVGEAPAVKLPQPARRTLDNGLRVVALPHHHLPRMALRLLVPAGAVTEPARRAGAASLLGAVLPEGTERRDADAVNRELDEMGAALSVNVGHDFAEVELGALSETLEPALALLAEVVARPAVDPAELERARAEALDALRARGDEPANLADDALAAELFGRHPYGRLVTGTLETVAELDREALLALHAERYRPADSVLVAAGDFQADALFGILERVFAGWTGSAAPVARAEVPARPAAPGRRLAVPINDAAQAELRVGGRGMSRDDPEWVAAAVANYLLGGSTITGRLGANLREDKGWTYGVRSGFAAGVQPGGWTVETAVDIDVASRALDEIRAELGRFVAEPVPQEELQRAQDALVLSLPRAFETAGRTVARLSTVEAYGLPSNYWNRFAERVREVTTEQVQHVARRHFDPDALAWVAAGPAQEAL